MNRFKCTYQIKLKIKNNCKKFQNLNNCLEKISNCSEVAGHKVDIQKLIIFLYKPAMSK